MARAAFDPPRRSNALVLFSVALVITVLYFGQDFLVPIALAVLLGFVLAPLVSRLERVGFRRVLAVVTVIGVCLVGLGMLSWVVTRQVLDLANKLPNYSDNIHDKLVSFGGRRGGALDRLKQLSDQVSRDLASPQTTTSQASTQSTTQPGNAVGSRATEPPAAPPMGAVADGVDPLATTQPMPVRVVEDAPNAFTLLYQRLEPFLEPLATAGIVLIFIIFMLIAREDLRDRIIRLISRDEINLTTQAMDEAATRISRYLLSLLIVNLTYAIPIGVGLWLIGVPNATLWGLLACLLRFIPYIGPWIAASFPIALAFAVSPGWGLTIATIALFVVIELISNNVVEPWLYGKNTGISAVAVIVAAVFWTWLWGTAGLFLSTPLTVCLAVIGKYVPQLGFLNILLGDEPVLSPPMRIYQRLLAQDPEEAVDLVDELLKEKPLVEVYDEVLVPALYLAEQDRHKGTLDDHRHRFVREGMREILEELADRQRLGDTRYLSVAPDSSTPGAAAAKDEGVAVLCLPARDEADELVAMMLSQCLELSGCSARYVPVAALASEMVQTAETLKSRIICVSALPPSALSHARYLCKRLEGRLEQYTLIVGLWTAKAELLAKAREKLKCRQTDHVVRSLAGALEQARPLMQTMKAAEGAHHPTREKGREGFPGEKNGSKEQQPERPAPKGGWRDQTTPSA